MYHSIPDPKFSTGDLYVMDELCELNYRILDRRDKRDKIEMTRGELMWLSWERENDSCVLKNYSKDQDLDVENGPLSETAEPSPDFMVPLLRYQKEWLAWALKQENSEVEGGILADEMGMGKTVQAIALVLAKRELQKASRDSFVLFPALPPTSTSEKFPIAVKGTIVICPGVGVKHWCGEIDRCSARGSTKTLVYHGANREKYMDKLEDYDFVITAYSTIEADYRKYMKLPKQNLSRTKSVLHSVKWERIILDEAHYIEDATSDMARAVLTLESSYKWALTGMPLQNRMGKFYSLVRFLQVIPYGCYFCKDCDCRALDYIYSFSTDCPHCPHKCTRHFLWWNRYITEPLGLIHHSKGGRDAMVLLKHKILKVLLLKRTKKERAADLALPMKTVSLRADSLDVRERDYYVSLQEEIKPQFEKYDFTSLDDNLYMPGLLADMHVVLTPLRQALDHQYLVEYSDTGMASGNTDAGYVEQPCSLCHDAVEDPVVNSSTHVFCKQCLRDLAASMEQVLCPSCTKLLTCDFTTNNDKGDSNSKPTLKGFRSSSILNRIQLDNFQTSTKLDALREEIRLMIERDGSAKGIVFSQFTSFLDLIHFSLQNHSGINCVQLVGSTSVAARHAAVTRFNEDPDCRILLMSLKAGGVALNLTAASHVFLMEPCLDPDLEQQAQDCVYRIGQYKPVRIMRFFIKDSIEEWIIDAQENKKQFNRLLSGSFEAWEKLSAKESLALSRRYA